MFSYCRILICRIRCNFWQSLEQFCTWGSFMRPEKSIFFYILELKCFNVICQGVRVPEAITIRLITPMGRLRTRYGNEAM